MKSIVKGQGLVFMLIAGLFVISSLFLTAYLYAQEGEDANPASGGSGDSTEWLVNYMADQAEESALTGIDNGPISDVFDERLNERSTDLDHQIDTQAYENDHKELLSEREKENYTDKYKQNAYTEAMDHTKQGDVLATLQVYDSKLGKEYMLTRTNDGVNDDAAGDKFKIQEVIRGKDAEGNETVDFKLINPSGEGGPNLHAQGLQVNYGFVKQGEDLSQVKYTGMANDVSLQEVNRLTNMGGREDTQNAFNIFREPPEEAPLEKPGSLTIRGGNPIPGGRIMGAGGDAQSTPKSVEINLGKDPQYVEGRNNALMGPDANQYDGIKAAESKGLEKIEKYLDSTAPQDTDDYINLQAKDTNRQIMDQAHRQFNTEGTP